MLLESIGANGCSCFEPRLNDAFFASLGDAGLLRVRSTPGNALEVRADETIIGSSNHKKG